MNEAKEGMKAMLFNLALAVTLASACPFSARCQAQEIQLSSSDSLQEIIEKAAAVRQSPRQVEWQKIEYAAFVHFGMNTFTDKEWGEGDEDPALFNPTKLDARQWMKIFKAAGMREVVLTAKHHDGFCLWPSAYTDHSVKNSPWRGGKGDVVKEASEAAREAGLKFGVYLSPWDRHEPSYGTEAYNDYYKNQLRELLTNYGEIAEVWMDGACGDGDPRCNATPYDWQGYFDIVRELQPNAVISIVGPDVRWVGNEAGNARASEWSALPENYDAMAENLGSREKLLEAAARSEWLARKPAQVDVSIRPGWFYHKSQDYMLRPDERLLDIYYGSVGGNAALLLNVPPDKRGLIAKSDAMALKKLKIALDDAFDVNYAEGRSAAAANDSEQPGHEADHAVDGNQDTFWTAKEGAESAELIVDLGRKETFDVAMLQENILLGQRIEAFFIDAWDGSVWNEIAGSGTVGYKRLLRFDETTTDRVRIRIAKSRLNPTLAEVGLYYSKKDENPPAAVNGSSEEYFPSLPAGKKLKLVWERRIQRAEAGRSEMEPSDGPPARRLLARGRCEL